MRMIAARVEYTTPSGVRITISNLGTHFIVSGRVGGHYRKEKTTRKKLVNVKARMIDRILTSEMVAEQKFNAKRQNRRVW